MDKKERNQEQPVSQEVRRKSYIRGVGYDYTGRFRVRPEDEQRSDDEIQEDIAQLLEEQDSFDASTVEVEVEEARVRLHGLVEDEEIRQQAESIVLGVAGIRVIDNQLKTKEDGSA
jgi:osmotically-inducible protein OsmY